MNYTRIALISLLLSTSLYPAATPPRSCDGAHASASVAPAAEVKRAAADHESRGRAEAHEQADQPFDLETDTAQSEQRCVAPTAEALKQADEVAQKLNSPLPILTVLAQSYADKDHDFFADDLFNKWCAVCTNKNILNAVLSNQDVVIFREIAQAIRKEEESPLPIIVWCCVGIADSYSVGRGLRDQFVLRNVLRLYQGAGWFPRRAQAFRAFSRYSQPDSVDIPPAHQLYRDAQKNIPLMKAAITAATHLLPELARIVENYVRRERMFVADRDVQVVEGKIDLAGKMIGSLEGLRDCAGAATHLKLGNNFISRIGLLDLPEESILEEIDFTQNPLTSIAPYAFARQTHLKTLNLSQCSLREISRAMLAGLMNLESLDISNNNIRRIEAGALSQLQSLRGIDLSKNALQVVPEDLQKVATQGKLISFCWRPNPFEQNAVEAAKVQGLLELVQQNYEANQKKEQQ